MLTYRVMVIWASYIYIYVTVVAEITSIRRCVIVVQNILEKIYSTYLISHVT